MEPATAKRRSHWRQDPDAVKADILKVATEEFAKHGLSGARVDEIARRTKSSKRMIYYYFEDKDGLYLHVLEAAYERLRQGESELNLEGLGPVEALAKLTEMTFDTHLQNADFIRLVMIENIHHGEHIQRSQRIPKLNISIIEILEAICLRGKAEGLFYDDVDPLHLHWIMSAFGFYNVSNRATFSFSFGQELYSNTGQAELKRRLVATVLRASVRNVPAHQVS